MECFARLVKETRKNRRTKLTDRRVVLTGGLSAAIVALSSAKPAEADCRVTGTGANMTRTVDLVAKDGSRLVLLKDNIVSVRESTAEPDFREVSLTNNFLLLVQNSIDDIVLAINR